MIGPNGAGKTTLFNLLTGFDKPNHGDCRSTAPRSQAFLPSRPHDSGKYALPAHEGPRAAHRAGEHEARAKKQSGERMWASLLPFLWRAQETEIEAKARDLLARFKLDAKEKDFAASLSGGQRKLLEMARALMSDPTLVMLDEPMAGVNPALTESLLEHILNLKDEGMTVLFVEHDMHMVRHIADWSW